MSLISPTKTKLYLNFSSILKRLNPATKFGWFLCSQKLAGYKKNLLILLFNLLFFTLKKLLGVGC